jgi:hypothetical protein
LIFELKNRPHPASVFNMLGLIQRFRPTSLNPCYFTVSRQTAFGGGRQSRPADENETLTEARFEKGIIQVRLTG